MRRFRNTLAACVLTIGGALASGSNIGAQAVRGEVRPDSLINAALARALAGDTAQALDLLERANKLAPKDPETLYWRGLMLARTTVLGIEDVPRNILAWRLLNRAADLDPTNARYWVEMGRIRLKTPLLRLEAERLFRRALSVAEKSGDNSQVAEIAFELGQVKDRRYRSTKDRYMITSPGMIFSADDALHVNHYTREFLSQHAQPLQNIGSVDRSEAEELYRRGLAANAMHEGNAIGLMGVLYDQQRYREMSDIARTFLVAGAGSPRIRLAAGLAAYRRGRMPDAEKLFNQAMAQYSPAEREELLGIGRIVRAQDSTNYAGLSAIDRLHTDSAYWEAADPMLATPENEGRLEYFARIAYSDLKFTDSEFRQVGWRTDRGMIIARYGEPPVIASFVPGNSPDAIDAIGRVITVWFYPHNEVQYVFTGPPAMNYARFAGDMRGYAEENRQDHPFLLDNVPFAASVDTVPMQVARFRGSKPGSTQLLVAAKVNTPKLYGGVELDRSALELSLRVGPPSRMRLTASDTINVSLPAKTPVSHVWKHEVPSGQYRVRVEAFDRSVRTALGRGQAEVATQPAPDNALALSDLLIAHRSATPDGAISGLDDPSLKPRSDLSLAPQELFTVYWETYGLKPNAQDRVSIDVRVQVTLLEIDRSKQSNLAFMLGNIADAIGVTQEGSQTLGVKFHRDETLGQRDRVPQIMSLGLGSSPAGTYKLEFFVTDKNAGTTAHSERIIYKSRQ